MPHGRNNQNVRFMEDEVRLYAESEVAAEIRELFLVLA